MKWKRGIFGCTMGINLNFTYSNWMTLSGRFFIIIDNGFWLLFRKKHLQIKHVLCRKQRTFFHWWSQNTIKHQEGTLLVGLWRNILQWRCMFFGTTLISIDSPSPHLICIKSRFCLSHKVTWCHSEPRIDHAQDLSCWNPQNKILGMALTLVSYCLLSSSSTVWVCCTLNEDFIVYFYGAIKIT